ncbi:MAG: FlgD immunoglobulin-like domain containing protein, partial [Candidatus Zixiibacteriota bacterium]
NSLIAGGGFGTAGGVVASNIAAWDGLSWSSLGSGMNDEVYTLTVHDNKLIAGGDFNVAGSKVSAYLAAWTKHATSIEDKTETGLPAAFKLSQNYPNPFNPETRIEFTLPRASHVTIEIYNILGRKVKTLVNQRLSAGNKAVTWDGTDDDGSLVSSGVYLYRIKAGDFVEAKKMVLLK